MKYCIVNKDSLIIENVIELEDYHEAVKIGAVPYHNNMVIGGLYIIPEYIKELYRVAEEAKVIIVI